MLSKKNPLKFDVLRLKAGPEEHQLSESASVFGLEDDPEYSFKEPINLELLLKLAGETVLISGKISTVAKATCARCLEELPLSLSANFHLAYMDDPRLLDLDKNPELEDDGTFYYDGESVDLTEELRELLLLELPSIPACTLKPGDICPVRNVQVSPFVFGPRDKAGKPIDSDAVAEEEAPGSLAAQLKKIRKEIK
jgi:DUF177 domain-containing protein